MPTLAEVGERVLIERFTKHIHFLPNMPVPHWDDVNAVSLGDGRCIVLKTDMLVWATDVPIGMSPFQVGRKVVVMNFSDLGSKGVQPQAFLASLGAPSVTQVEDIEEVVRGFNSAAREYGGYMVGGDTNEACDIVIAGIAYGLAEESQLILRNGSRPGDILCTTGGFGSTTSAFKILLEGAGAPNGLKDRLLNSIYMPKARVRAGIALSLSGIATSSIDSSDGLAVSLYDLQRSSGNGFKLNTLPLTKDAKEFASIHSISEADLALYGGEEYELIFTVKAESVDRARKLIKSIGINFNEIGIVTREKKIVYFEDAVEKPIENKGWEHFKGMK